MTNSASLEEARSLVALWGEQLAFVVNMSGGKDSLRMLGYLKEHFPTQTMYAVMADTGFEHVKPVSAVEWAQAQAESFGLSLHVVRNPNKTYLTMVETRRMFPSASTRQCTSDLKRGPIQKFVRSIKEKIIINCTGIRAEESLARSKQTPWKYDDGMSKNGRTVFNWMPIFEHTLNEVLHWHHLSGNPLHPVYVPEYHIDGTTGGYLRRFSCRVCIFATDAEIIAIHQHDREAFDIIAGIEERIGFSMKNGKTLVQIVDQSTRQAQLFECCAA